MLVERTVARRLIALQYSNVREIVRIKGHLCAFLQPACANYHKKHQQLLVRTRKKGDTDDRQDQYEHKQEGCKLKEWNH